MDLISFAVSLLGRIFPMRPRISREGDVLVAASPWFTQVFSLGFGARRVSIDPRARAVRVTVRRFWFATATQTVRFDEVYEVLYGYTDVSAGVGAYQETDMFTVGLQLKHGGEVLLFRFVGQGDFANNTANPDWMMWADFKLADITAGSQESDSLAFADLVSRMIGVEISNPMP